MQLWGRMAQQQAAYHQQQQQSPSAPSSPQQQPQQPQPQLTGLASGLRPHFFAKSPTLSAILAGKPHAGAYPSQPPASSPPSPLRSAGQFNQEASGAHVPTPTAQQAMLASIASQTLLGKLGSAFWDAFSGSAGPVGPGARSWDADKVRRVLEGKAVVRVVDVEPVAVPAVEKMVVVAGPSVARGAPRLASDLSEKPAKNNASLVDMLGSLRI